MFSLDVYSFFTDLNAIIRCRCQTLCMAVCEPDLPENCHLNVKKLPKTLYFFQKICQKLKFFQKGGFLLHVFF